MTALSYDELSAFHLAIMYLALTGTGYLCPELKFHVHVNLYIIFISYIDVFLKHISKW